MDKLENIDDDYDISASHNRTSSLSSESDKKIVVTTDSPKSQSVRDSAKKTSESPQSIKDKLEDSNQDLLKQLQYQESNPELIDPEIMDNLPTEPVQEPIQNPPVKLNQEQEQKQKQELDDSLKKLTKNKFRRLCCCFPCF